MSLAHLTRIARRVASATALLALLVGIPAGLVGYVGWPLPRTVPATAQGWSRLLTSGFPDTAVVSLLACALWIVWAAFVYSVLAELHATRRDHIPRPIRAISPMQALAALLIAGITAGPLAVSTAIAAPPPVVIHTQPAAHTGILTAPTGYASAPEASDRSGPPASAAPTTLGSASPVGTRAQLPRFAVTTTAGRLLVDTGGRGYTVDVKPGDTLWDIAAAWLGDPTRWAEIYHLNAHRYDPGGRMRHGDHIEAGWTLILPADATPPPTAQPQPAQTPDQADSTPPATAEPAPPTKPVTTPTPTTAPTPAATPTPPATTPSRDQADHDDGVVAAPSPPAQETPPAGQPTGQPTPAASPSNSTTRPATPPGIGLPGGSWIDLGLAAAVATAAALVWAHRRRRYTPRRPTPTLRLDEPALAPLPGIVGALRRGLRHRTADTTTVDQQAAGDDAPTVDIPAVDLPAPVVPALDNPIAGLWPPAGLGLTGPGAQAAGRGFLVATLASGGVDDPDGRGQVIIPGGTLVTLLGTAVVDLPRTPRLNVPPVLGDALDLLDEEILHRTRILYDHEVDDITALRRADPDEETMPPFILIADPAQAHERARIAALAAQGQRLDIHAILLGAWPDGDTIIVATDGATSPADTDTARHGSHPADVGRLTVLTPSEAADLIATLAESHTGDIAPPAPAEPSRSDDTGQPAAGPYRNLHMVTPEPPTSTISDSDSGGSGDGSGSSGPAQPAIGDPSTDTGLSPPARAVTSRAEADPVAAPHDSDPAAELAADDAPPPRVDGGVTAEPGDVPIGPVQVRVLGSPHVVGVDATTGEPLRPQSLELLVYLATRGDTLRETVLEDVLGDVPHSKAPARLNTYVYNLRRVLKRVGGPQTYVEHPPHGRYWLNTDAFDIDLWRMRTALTEADTATDPQTRIAALRRAVDAYPGPLADGHDYVWIEPYREGVRQQALDAHLALAGALIDQPAEALAVVTATITHDPYAETLYQHAMRLHAQLGDMDAIRGLRRTLTRRLAEIDAEPGDDTIALAERLVADLHRHQRRRRDDDTAA